MGRLTDATIWDAAWFPAHDRAKCDHPSMTNHDTSLTANQLREILADALVGASNALRRPLAGPVIRTTPRWEDRRSSPSPTQLTPAGSH